VAVEQTALFTTYSSFIS